METFRFNGVLVGSWEVSPEWVGFDSSVTYTLYKTENFLYVVRHGVYRKKNEHYFTVYQLDASKELVELEKLKVVDFTETEVLKFGGKRKGSWYLPPPCFKGEKENFYTVYEANDGSYTIICEEAKKGKEDRVFLIYQFSSLAEATDSEIGKILPPTVFV